MGWTRYKIPAFWKTAEQAMSNKQKEAFNEWKQDNQLRLEAIEILAKDLLVHADGTPNDERVRKLVSLARETHRKINETTPLMNRSY